MTSRTFSSNIYWVFSCMFLLPFNFHLKRCSYRQGCLFQCEIACLVVDKSTQMWFNANNGSRVQEDECLIPQQMKVCCAEVVMCFLWAVFLCISKGEQLTVFISMCVSWAAVAQLWWNSFCYLKWIYFSQWVDCCAPPAEQELSVLHSPRSLNLCVALFQRDLLRELVLLCRHFP